jgi:cytochrome c-type protein NapC
MEGGQGAEFTGKLEEGVWTVEMRRKLQSDKPGDVPLALDKIYNFGFAVHDDFTSARYHHVSLGYRLGFDNEEAEINAVKREASAAPAAGDAPAATVAPAAGDAAVPAATVAPSASAADTSDIDWSKASSREVTVFYPGQASMEWTLNGREHGGARPFTKMGDRCFNCHEQDAADVGEKIVTGEKLEPNVIPDKRGSIPVQVQATHDEENLYLRFEWTDTGHTPAPFVDGGKMDPDNPVKLALMLATDDVEYAEGAGCWGTCHHDLNTMPDAANDEVTKYLTESRTEIEIKGKNGKKRGGWDKRKDDAAIKTEIDGGHFMDMLRFKSGTGESEDGHVLADRVMEGGQGVEFTGQLDGDTWSVVLKRKLTSDKSGDLSLAMDKVYNLGFAIHDDFTSARYHHVSLGYKLGFDNDEAEINAVSQ